MQNPSAVWLSQILNRVNAVQINFQLKKNKNKTILSQCQCHKFQGRTLFILIFVSDQSSVKNWHTKKGQQKFEQQRIEELKSLRLCVKLICL